MLLRQLKFGVLPVQHLFYVYYKGNFFAYKLVAYKKSVIFVCLRKDAWFSFYYIMPGH